MKLSRSEIYYSEVRRRLRLLARRLVLSLTWLPVVRRQAGTQRILREEAAYTETVRVLALLQRSYPRSRSRYHIRYEHTVQFPAALSHVYVVFFFLDSPMTNSDCSALVDADTDKVLMLTSGHYFSYVTYHEDGSVSDSRGL